MDIYYDPYDYFRADPYPMYARLRESAPVYHNEDLGFWALSRHADVDGSLRDPWRFSNADGISIEPAATGPTSHRLVSIAAMDPPAHTSMRAAVAPFFTPRKIAVLEEAIRKRTRTKLAEAIERDKFDFITDFASKLPMEAVATMMGVPTADRAEIRRLAELLVRRGGEEKDLTDDAIMAIMKLEAYYIELVSERRRHRRDDLISALWDAPGGRRWTHGEIAAFCFLLTSAGHAAVVQLLGNAWYWAWRNPAQRRTALTGRFSDWIAETLRFDTPTQLIGRTALVDVDISGTTIPAGARVFLLLGSANRDPDVFPDPDRYDLDRDTSKSLSFSIGPHLCLGRMLTLLIARAVLEETIDHVVDYELDESGVQREVRAESRGFAVLPTTVRRRESSGPERGI